MFDFTNSASVILGQSYNTGLTTDWPGGLSFSYNGQYMYFFVSSPYNYGRLRQYTLSTPWNPSTATYTRIKDIPISGYMCSNYSWNSSGTLFTVCENNQHGYGAGNGRIGTVYQYTLSTSWDISTITQTRTKDLTANGDFNPVTDAWRCDNFVFSPDGTKGYWQYSGGPSSWLQYYTLSTPWDISTATYTNKMLDLHNIEQYSYGGPIRFSSDGYIFYWYYNGKLIKAVMTTPWDISTAVVSGTYPSAVQQHTTVSGVPNYAPKSGWFSQNDSFPNFYQQCNDQYIYRIQAS